MDAVNRGSSKNFYVMIEFERLGAERPKDEEVFRPLENWLAGPRPRPNLDRLRADRFAPEQNVRDPRLASGV
jgi:hypothetical protein